MPGFNEIDFSLDNSWVDLFYGEPSPQRIKELNQFLKADPNRFIRLYHGTSSKHEIIKEGLLPTSLTRKHSLQSSLGYVCLSIYPNMAKLFGEMAYPGEDITVYSVLVTVRSLLADRDQLNNQRAVGKNIKNSLAESLAYGHGARVKGRISNNCISIWENKNVS